MIAARIRINAIIAVTSLIFTLCGRLGVAQSSAASTAHSSATIIQGLTISTTSNLHFGAMIPGVMGGTATVSAAGARSATGSIILLISSNFPAAAASFNLIGQPNLAYTVTLPTTATLTLQGGSSTITLGSFTSNPASSSSLSSTGGGTLTVGGTVTVSASQANGVYSGTFTVTLSYQ